MRADTPDYRLPTCTAYRSPVMWWCQCPEPVTDDYGKRGVCKAAARIVTTSDQESTSGPVLLVRIKCDRNHWNDQLFEEVVLYG